MAYKAEGIYYLALYRKHADRSLRLRNVGDVKELGNKCWCRILPRKSLEFAKTRPKPSFDLRNTYLTKLLEFCQLGF